MMIRGNYHIKSSSIYLLYLYGIQINDEVPSSCNLLKYLPVIQNDTSSLFYPTSIQLINIWFDIYSPFSSYKSRLIMNNYGWSNIRLLNTFYIIIEHESFNVSLNHLRSTFYAKKVLMLE